MVGFTSAMPTPQTGSSASIAQAHRSHQHPRRAASAQAISHSGSLKGRSELNYAGNGILGRSELRGLVGRSRQRLFKTALPAAQGRDQAGEFVGELGWVVERMGKLGSHQLAETPPKPVNGNLERSLIHAQPPGRLRL